MPAKNRVAVFLRIQNPATDVPAHRASPSLARKVLQASLARPLEKDHKMIQLTTDEAWQFTKDRFRTSPQVVLKPAPLAPPLPFYPCFTMSYPPTMYETDAVDRRERIWMRGVNRPVER